MSRITKHGKHVATEEKDMVCERCGCEFTVEPGDRLRFIDLTNDNRNRHGRVTARMRHTYWHTNCPECDESVTTDHSTEELPL